MRLDAYFDDYYAPSKLLGKSQNTFRLYRVCFQHLANTLGRPAELSDLNDTTIRKHLQRLLDEGRSKATVNKERCSIVALWRHACQKKMVDSWPDIPKYKEPVRTPMAWTRDDVEQLLTACRRSEGYVGTCPAHVYWTALVMTCLDTAERIGAIMQAEWDWLESDSILIRGEARKGGKRDKWFRLSPDTMTLLGEVRRYRQSERIFHWPYSHTYLWRRYKSLVERAGLPTGRRSGYHRLRRTAASVCYAAGMDPQELLDHTDRRTTQRYLDPRHARQTQASDILAAWLRSPGGLSEPQKKAQ